MTVRVRTYLALAFIIAALMPLAILWAWPYSQSLEAQKEDARERHLLVAENLASALEAYHRDIVTLFGTYADLIASGGGQEARPLFESLSFRHVCVADAATGKVVVAYYVDRAACPDFVPPERFKHLLALAEGDGIGVSEVVQSKGERDRIYLSTKAGTSLVIGAIYTDYFKHLRRHVKFGRKGHAAIVDKSGHAISHPFEDTAEKVLDLSGIAPVLRLRNGEAGVDTFYSVPRQEQMIAGFAPVQNTGWGVIVPQPLRELEESASSLNRDALLVLCVGIAFSLLIALTLAQQLSRRLGDIASAVHEIAQESDDIHVLSREHLVGIRELEDLERDVNQVADGVASARRIQRDHNRDLELANARLTREMADRLTAEAARKTSEIRFRSLFESAPIPIREEDLSGMKRLIDEVGLPDPVAFGAYIDRHPEFLEACSKAIVVVDANRASLEQHGYSDKSEMLANVVRKLSPAAKRIVRMTAETLHSGGAGRSYETEIRRADGSTRTVAAKWSVIRGHEATYARILLSSIDITERLDSEEALRQSQKMEAVGQLTGGVAHDFNNLLTVISGNIDLMQETAGLDPELAAPIEKAVRRGAELTQRLLAFSRKQSLSPQTIDLGSLVRGMTDLLQRSLGDEIVVKIDLEERLWMATADPGQVETAILNLALNSRDAMPEGGTLTLSSRNAVVGDGDGVEAAPGDYVVLTISDTGVGMTPEVLARACEPFYTTKEIGKGSGLGLSSVYGFAKQSAGDVRIETREGAGTTVSLYLPRTRLPCAPADHTRGSATRPNGIGLTVLVLEDHTDVLEYLQKLMRSLGFRVLTAETAAAARTVVEDGGAIDLLISDVMLPGGIRGPEFANEILRRAPDTGVILISGRPDKANTDAFPNLEGVQVLPKPFTREQLLEKVEAALGAAAHSA